MTQEGQALPSPTPPENPVEPNTASDLSTKTNDQTEQDNLGARVQNEIEEGKQQEDIGEREEQGEVHSKGNGRAEVEDAGGEAEPEEGKVDSIGDVDQKTDGGAEGERGGMTEEGCINVEIRSVGEEAKCEVEEIEKTEEDKGNDKMQPYTEEEATPQADGFVYTILFNVALSEVL